MRHVGLDVHAKQSTFVVLDANGRKLKTRTVHGSWNRLLGEMIKVKQPFAVCFEASIGYGHLYERLSEIAERVVVAHPGHLRLIFRSKRKNDRVDAHKLAKLLYLDEVPTVHVPSLDVRAWRRLIGHRHRLINERTRTKNKIRAQLRAHGVAAPKSLWSRSGMAWLRSLNLPTEMDKLMRDIHVADLESRKEPIERVEKLLGQIARKHAGVCLLMTIPGVGIRTAEAVNAYIDDPRRFSRNSQVGSYFGLVPCQDQSAGKNRLGHITRQGSHTVRRLLTEAAWQGVRRSPEIRAYFERIHQGKPDRKKIAIVATAHYLARVMHAMLMTGEIWRCSSAA